MTSTERRFSSSSNTSESVKFPDFEPSPSTREHFPIYEEEENDFGSVSRRSPSPNHPFGKTNGAPHSERWQPRRENRPLWSDVQLNGGGSRHGRQKSLGEAINNVRNRKASVSANAHEIAEALKAPVSVRLITLCLIWYLSSALTNTSSKSILNAFPQPITLTLVQFAFVATWCMFFAYLARLYPPLQKTIPVLAHGIRYPTREVISTTLPLALFQIGGHVLSSTATSLIPVSLVHTIKGLSPLFTVLAYRFIYNIHYSTATYLSLIPLTFGVILACSVEFSGNIYGILYAFFAALIFVTQNIFSKKLFNEAARVSADSFNPHSSGSASRKLDKLNLLCYCSGLAFLLTCPIWFWTEGLSLLRDLSTQGSISLTSKPNSLDHGRLTLEFIFNGIFHFGQNIIAFVLLSMVSPVTYSVASLIKRVFIIVVAIVWFGNRTTPIQACGILLTFLGLYLYDRTSDAAKADRRAKLEELRSARPLLPLTTDLIHHNKFPVSNESSKDPNNAARSTATQVGRVSTDQAFGPLNGYFHAEERKGSDSTMTAEGGRKRSGSMEPVSFSLPRGGKKGAEDKRDA